ncbi:MAG TPA: adenylate/guanylate cyclase domain-containing protein, partial [Candidatus Limnocylindrales bacterium]
ADPDPDPEADLERSPIVASLAEVGDRRVVTALFADLVDYVRMIAEHDPEEVRARVGAALRGMADTIERLDGTREKFIGDAVFAVFGWPTAHDDDPIRAALAALAIRATLREPLDGGEAIEVRIGLATGEVVAGSRGDGTGDLAVTGEAITTAARIQSLARPGEILLDEATVRGGRDRLAVDDRGSIVLRGQSSDVHIYALTGEVGLVWPRRHRSTSEGPLVGRREETARIRKVLRRTKRTGQGAVVLLTGEAGMGKSRLVADVEAEARDLGFAWTWTENVSYGRGEPYRFARVFAQAVADEHGTDSGSFARQLLFHDKTDPATVRRYAGAIAAIARAASFSGWEAEADLVPDDPAETATILGEVGIAYIERLLAMDGPRVVVLDDVHWIDTSSVGLLELIVSTAAARSLVLIATMRPGPLPAWADLPHVDRIDLSGLRAPETAQLATIVARAALDAQDARRIHERTQGNPLFIGETVRASIEDGTLELRDGRMSLVESRAPQLPLTLRAVLGARIDGLDPTARDVLGVASVIGIGFRDRELEDLLERPIPPRTLDRLVDAALVLPVDDGTWRFSHPLVHEAAYAGLLSSRRRRLHARLADRIESGPGPVSIPALAVHRAASGDAKRAIPLLVEAAASAASMGAASEAAGFWRTAAELTAEPADQARFRDAAASAQAVRSR